MKKILVALMLLTCGSVSLASKTQPLPPCDGAKLTDSDCLCNILVSTPKFVDSVSWSHNFALESGYSLGSVNSARLEIKSLGVRNILEQDDTVKIYFMGTELGSLQASRFIGGVETTSFDLGSNKSVMDGIFNAISSGQNMAVKAELKFVSDSTCWFNWDSEDTVAICQSKLTVCVNQFKDAPLDNNTPAVPAPGAILLSGLGTIAVGAIRRHGL